MKEYICFVAEKKLVNLFKDIEPVDLSIKNLQLIHKIADNYLNMFFDKDIRHLYDSDMIVDTKTGNFKIYITKQQNFI
jgi:hypothetical protein